MRWWSGPRVAAVLVGPRVAAALVVGWLACGLCAGCSLWKRSERSASLESRLHRYSLLDSGGWRLERSVRWLEFERADQRALILPRGLVRLHPDSGFSGEAGLVLVETARQAAALGDESVGVERSLMRSRDSLDSQLSHADDRWQETDVQPVWQLPWWGWGVGLMVLVAVAVAMVAFVCRRRKAVCPFRN